ncbi:PilZ domain-containing protein [Mobilitalea sibirica]|uniref:PilZ domain-containing protein n=1 Tax=Mobilitalea sibirica TaxID=1462919 RepID=A0A8J7H8T6_9FIRM|nr:PilZ domain-containing protein [Mobilitalea sibirica]MBH1940520.1 PilZ domain-containing protein [Mobilitalea sibirica]
MLIDELPKGGNIELEVKYSGQAMSFRSNIIAIKNNSVLITAVKVNDQTIGFSEKCQINFLFKTDGKVFLWEKIDVKLVKYDGQICHKIDLYGEGKSYNRRESYRLYIGEDMPLYVNTASGPSAISVLVKDISETGVAFITKDEIDIDRTIRLKLKDNNTLISLSGVVLRKEYLPNLDSNLYGCRFNEKNNMLGKYIAKKQGEQLRKKAPSYSSPPTRERKK